MSLRVWPETEAAIEMKKRQSDGEWRHFAVMDLAGAAEPTLSVAGILRRGLLPRETFLR